MYTGKIGASSMTHRHEKLTASAYEIEQTHIRLVYFFFALPLSGTTLGLLAASSAALICSSAAVAFSCNSFKASFLAFTSSLLMRVEGKVERWRDGEMRGK